MNIMDTERYKSESARLAARHRRRELDGEPTLVRVQYQVFPTREEALRYYPDAEYGVWQPSPSRTVLVEGYIALDVDDD